jgi:putative hydrolase of HD superfamily
MVVSVCLSGIMHEGQHGASNAGLQRLRERMEFLVEIDKAKAILRTSRHLHGDDLENDAEHSWHLGMMAIVLSEYAAAPVDILRVVKMVLIHDLVEIDAGDTDAFDENAKLTQRVRELKAADRIFALLPPDVGRDLRSVWDEFEARETAEAQFAVALDHLAGVLANAHANGGCWRDVPVERIKARNNIIENGSPTLWRYAEEIIDAFEKDRQRS